MLKNLVLLLFLSSFMIIGCAVEEPITVEPTQTEEQMPEPIIEEKAEAPEIATEEEISEEVVGEAAETDKEETLERIKLQIPEKIYSKTITNKDQINLKNNDILEIADTHYIFENNIFLEDNAQLIIKNSLLDWKKDYTNQYKLEAKGNSKVTLEDSIIKQECTGSMGWAFLENSQLESIDTDEDFCNVWHLFADNAKAIFKNRQFKGGGLTVCDEAQAEIENAKDIEFELCLNENSILDISLPAEIKEWSFPPGNSKNIKTTINIKNSTIDGWGIGVNSDLNQDLTFRDAPRVTVSIGVAKKGTKVTLEGLAKKHYDDQIWNIGSSKLRLINSATYGWEPNVWGGGELTIRNSNFTGATLNSADSKQTIEDSELYDINGYESVQITVKNSKIKGNVVGNENSRITIIDSEFLPEEENFGYIVASDNSIITLINSHGYEEVTENDNGEVRVQ